MATTQPRLDRCFVLAGGYLSEERAADFYLWNSDHRLVYVGDARGLRDFAERNGVDLDPGSYGAHQARRRLRETRLRRQDFGLEI